MKGVKVNSTNNKKETPLIIASKNGHINIVRNLLRFGAEIDAKDINGMTAYDYAMQNNNNKIITLLQQNIHTQIYEDEVVYDESIERFVLCWNCNKNPVQIIFNCGHCMCHSCSILYDECKACRKSITCRINCYF